MLLWSLPLGNINTSFVIINHPKFCRFVAWKFAWQEYLTIFANTISKVKSYSYARQTKMLVNKTKSIENHLLFGDQWWKLCSKSIIHIDIHQHTHHLFLLCSHSFCPWSNHDQHQSLVPTHSDISHDQRSHNVNYQEKSHTFHKIS